MDEPPGSSRGSRDPELRVIDASWYLPAQKRDARAEYAAAHLPGAVFVDLVDRSRRRCARRCATRSRRPDALARAFASRGIGSDHHVVVYDRLGGYSAGRIWWSLRYAGHDERVAARRRLRALARRGPAGDGRGTARFAPARLRARSRGRISCAARPTCCACCASGGAQIVDARSAARFRGDGEEHTRHKGHIPGSRSVPYDANLGRRSARASSRPPSCARSTSARACDLDRPIITSCGSGVTAALDAFALALLGHPNVSVYDGSWAEWGDSDDVPIALGES